MAKCGLRQYYDRRANEYEQIYARNDPVRQSELAAIAEALRAALARRRVLEVACGTGYWTSVVAPAAKCVVATDLSSEMLAIARQKPLGHRRVQFRVADAHLLCDVPGSFDAALAMFWLSHVPKARLHQFLTQLHARLEPATTVFLADNIYVPGVGGELVRRPGCEDSFKRRTLADGSEHEIVKNYYEPDHLSDLLRPWTAEPDIRAGSCFWWLSYQTPG